MYFIANAGKKKEERNLDISYYVIKNLLYF